MAVSADVMFFIVSINSAFVLSPVNNSQGFYNNSTVFILMGGIDSFMFLL